MFTNYMNYRKTNGIDTILQDYKFDLRPEVFPHYSAGYCGVDKLGRPIYIEKNGKFNPDGVWAAIEEDNLLRALMTSYEG